MVEALDIWVKGIVQGVGFRPFVYRLAKRYLINGWVLNAVDGVHIHAEGESQHLDEFVLELSENAPAAAQVTEIELHEVPLEQFDSFEIRFSDDESSAESTLVSPDLALCADCERELFSPADRRFRYPFINCTNCGPRFTITDALPYDRANTSMRAFPMCAACRAEYEDPADRRFHAQPDACFECGPHLTWRAPGDAEPIVAASREASDELLTRASQLLVAGGILAVKGLGGYHLACDARNPEAVARLRQRKGRDGKAFALMMRTPADVRQLCTVSTEEEAILTGMERPIVLLRRRPDAPAPLPPEVAGPLPELGIMLPYTPVQHLLLHDFAALLADMPNGAPNGGGTLGADASGDGGAPALVMTSGNVHDEPIITDDDVAFRELAHIADAFLGNDREILTRFDDSVLRVLDFGPDAGQAMQFIRRARGYAPAPLRLPMLERTEDAEPTVTFATGPEQKNTFTFLRGGQAFVSQHLGDVENVATFDAWQQTKVRYQELFGLESAALAADLHPEYLTTKWALEQAALTGEPLTHVQHHHAHIVAAMAENGQRGPVCGIAFDGTGYGADGNIWGGEVLLANLHAYERFANFAYVPMPGGAAVIRHPLRMAYGVLWEADLLEHPGAAPALAALGPEQAELCGQMIERGLNTPVTSSVGRLFDAASALLGICTEPTYEGEAAILLEACMSNTAAGADGEPGPAATSAPDSAHPAQGTQGAGEETALRAQSARTACAATSAARPADASSDMQPATAAPDDRYAVGVIKNTAAEGDTAQTTSAVLLDAAPTFAALLDDLAAGVPVPVIARRFHDAMAGAVIIAAQLARALYDITDVALTGGVFMNRYITERAVPRLAAEGFTVILNRELPPNDACVSLGQAVAARLSHATSS